MPHASPLVLSSCGLRAGLTHLCNPSFKACTENNSTAPYWGSLPRVAMPQSHESVKVAVAPTAATFAGTLRSFNAKQFCSHRFIMLIHRYMQSPLKRDSCFCTVKQDQHLICYTGKLQTHNSLPTRGVSWTLTKEEH